MAKYKLLDSGVYDNENGLCIPEDENNRHWQQYLSWVAADNTADAQYTVQELEDKQWEELRWHRDTLLNQTDFMMTYDFYNDILTTEEQTQVKNYRQSLRDLPDNTSDPNNVTWPEKPQVVIDYLP
jgi:hypothetical protein